MSSENVLANFTTKQIGLLKGHNGWVTKICVSPQDADTIMSASRDKSLLIWRLYGCSGEMCGKMVKSLESHNHFVSDCAVSKDGGFIISASWDRTLRLWDLNKGIVKRTFVGHTNDVTSVSFSMDNRQIVSGSRDCTVRLWNTLAVLKFVFEENGHRSCVSSVLTVPQSRSLSILSSGYDGLVKTWGLFPPHCKKTFYGHSLAVNSMSISPNGSLVASGGKDGLVNLWDINENKPSFQYSAGAPVNGIAFNPRYYVIAAASGPTIKLYNVKKDENYTSLAPVDLDDTKPKPHALSVAWSNDGECLFAGYTDNVIRVFCVKPQAGN